MGSALTFEREACPEKPHFGQHIASTATSVPQFAENGTSTLSDAWTSARTYVSLTSVAA